MVYAYFDETEDPNYFIVGGVVSTSEKTLEDVIYHTRKYIKNIQHRRHRENLLNEIKDYYIDRNKLYKVREKLFYSLINQEIKKKGKKNIIKPRLDVFIFFMKYTKYSGESLKQEKKGTLYLNALCYFLSLDDFKNQEVFLTYDDFEDKHFESLLLTLQKENADSIKIVPGKSNEVKELQIADVCLGAYRRKLNNEDNNKFELIEKFVFISEIEADVIKI